MGKVWLDHEGKRYKNPKKHNRQKVIVSCRERGAR